MSAPEIREWSEADGDAPALPKLTKALELLRNLWAVDHELQVTSKRMSRELGVTGPQRLVVRMVGVSPGISAGNLARVLHMHKSTLTGILRRLEQLRMVTRHADPGDARRALFFLTPAGRRIDSQRTGTVEAAAVRVLGKLSGDDIEAAKRLLAALQSELARTDRSVSRRRG
jgi:DNA-binding MarR family transcriptional regulator